MLCDVCDVVYVCTGNADLTEWRTSFEEALRVKAPTSRTELRDAADVLIKQLEEFVDQYFATNEKQMDKTFVRTVQRCNKVIEDVRATRELAAATPPASVNSESTKVKRSLGFLVVVEDSNSMAWVRCHPALRFQYVQLS